MPSRYSKIQSTIWTSDKFNAAKEFSQKVYLYLLCCPHGNSAGLYRLPEGYAMTDLKCSQQRYQNALSDLKSVGLVEHDGDIVMVKQFLKFNPFMNPKHARGTCTEIAEFINNPLYSLLYKDVETFCIEYIEEFSKPKNSIDTVSIQYQNGISTETKTETKTKTETNTAHTRFESFWSSYPKKKAKGDAEKAFNKIKPDDVLLKTMLDAIDAQSRSPDWKKDGGQFIPYPATWLNQKRWEDEITKEKRESWERPVENYDHLVYDPFRTDVVNLFEKEGKS